MALGRAACSFGSSRLIRASLEPERAGLEAHGRIFGREFHCVWLVEALKRSEGAQDSGQLSEHRLVEGPSHTLCIWASIEC